ncbi:MAG: multiheme cyctochrome [Candidatus Syntrophoarchaeum butanivorans]|uniref:Multiheme cyctochrome n=1 Tax=Candidatus Syntropharchaeum butanivorans TaxID=1839936 RepID=A0A1F2P5N6_9EURY|nr:MAG: multiheme cyctochrome [Candidatus Syntrophoarchaeum butanivorans]
MFTAIIALGIFALPQTAALFSGQHSWYNLGTGGNDLPCEKCHGDIAAEMNSLVSAHSGETGYGRFECDYCHRTFDLNDYGAAPSQNINQSIFSRYYYTYASGDGTGSTPGKEAHAASTVPCMYCHSGEDVGGYHMHDSNTLYCSCHGPSDGGSDYYYHGDRFYTGKSNDDQGECMKCHQLIGNYVLYVPPAGGFNLTANATDTGSRAAHKKFVLDAIADSRMEDANEACIGCHTEVGVNISWTKNTVLDFTASENETGSWTITDFQATGDNTTESSYMNNWTKSY